MNANVDLTRLRIASELTEQDAPWPSALPIVAKISPEPYPLDALPEQIREAVNEVQGFVKAPFAMVASSALTAISLATQALYDVKRTEALTGPTGLFLLVIAESGERKSTCEGQFLSEIRRWENEQADAAKPELRKYSADFDSWKAERDGILLAIKEAGRKAKSVEKHRADLAELQSLEPQKPRVPRLLRADATPKALSRALAKEWPSAAIASSEGGAVLGAHGMGTDSVMRNLARFNILWDGGSLSVDRRTSESFMVKGARLTMSLQVQQAALHEFFAKTGKLARGTGFLTRFLVAWPESTQGTRTFVEPPDSLPALSAFHRSIRRLLETKVPIDNDGCLTPEILCMTNDAKEAWVCFFNKIEGELKPGGELADVRDVASKTADNAVRLAALFHAFGGNSGPIGIDAIDSGCCIAAWHLNEARRFFGEIALQPELIAAAKLDAWLIQRAMDTRLDSMSTTDVLQFGPAATRNRDKLTLALRELEKLNRARERTIGNRKEIEVNPSLVVSGGSDAP